MIQIPGYDSRFNLQSIMATVDITTGPDVLARPGRRTLALDFLDQRWVTLLDAIRAWVPVVWRGQKITTLTYGVQNVTSAWHITLAFNGLSHPMQLQPGMVLRIPTLTALNEALATLDVIRTAPVSSGGVTTI